MWSGWFAPYPGSGGGAPLSDSLEPETLQIANVLREYVLFNPVNDLLDLKAACGENGGTTKMKKTCHFLESCDGGGIDWC